MHLQSLAGIGFGLGAAFCQTLAYLFSRQFIAQTSRSPVLLLIVSHLLMGLGAGVLLLVMQPNHMPPLSTFIAPLTGAALFYLVAQWGLFHVLCRFESSRVAPLLGLKVVVLAIMAVALFRHGLHPWQWAAVGLSAIAAWLLNEAGGRLPARSVGTLAVTIVCYCLSDLNVGRLVARLAPVQPSPALVGAAFSYLICAGCVLPFAFRRDLWRRRVWTLATPYAAAWFGAMCLLYACFGQIGVVFGNIIQSSRGLMAVAVGWAVAHAGHTHLETRVGRRTVWRRALGAVLMMGAVGLYLLGP